MKINQAIETEDGNVTIQGTIEGTELALVLSVGLNYLYQQGAIPFLSKEKAEEGSLFPESETVQ